MSVLAIFKDLSLRKDCLNCNSGGVQDSNQKIQSLRLEIDQIHQDMAELFIRRLKLAHRIWEIKKSSNQPLVDSAREESLIHQFDHSTSQELEKIALQNFMKSLLKESKKYLEATLK